METRLNELIASYQTGQISDADFAELESLLKDSKEARELYHQASRMDTSLRRESENLASASVEFPSVPTGNLIAMEKRPFPVATWLAVAAAVVMGAAWIWAEVSKPKVIAELVSSENAAWESALPTEPGSKLTKGYLKLMEGIATIRFTSGAELLLEAPAKLMLKTSMKAKLNAGSAVMMVPESAQGFVLETPQGQAVDFGTSFAVSVSNAENKSQFEVVTGEISVHLPDDLKHIRLNAPQAATIIGNELTVYDEPIPEKDVESSERIIRLGTQGRSYSVIRKFKAKWLHPDKLMVKRKREPTNHERRAFFAFDVSAIDFEKVNSVRLRLNQVPSGIGYATRLPMISRVSVYGLINPEKSDWQPGVKWEEGPAREDGVRLGEIEIPRSEQRGSRVFSNAALLDFLKANRTAPVTFILEREISETESGVPSLVHAFASDLHPEASGPSLEFTLKDDTE